MKHLLQTEDWYIEDRVTLTLQFFSLYILMCRDYNDIFWFTDSDHFGAYKLGY